MTSDYKDLLEALNAFGVRYLIVGGHAVMKSSEFPFTKELELWVSTEAANANRIYTALQQFGAPLSDYSQSDFEQNNAWFQIGIGNVRIDILMSLPEIAFEEAWSRRVAGQFIGLGTNFISRDDLIKYKTACGRHQDIRDVKRLSKRANR